MITDNFIRFFTPKNHIKKSLDDWQFEWRKWVQTNRPQIGLNPETVEFEHNEIENKFLNLVFDFVSEESSLKPSPIKYIHKQIGEIKGFETSHIDEALVQLIRAGYLGKFFHFYYDLKKYRTDGNYSQKIDEQIIDWKDKIQPCIDIYNFVLSETVISLEDIAEAFSGNDYDKQSIEHFLRICCDWQLLKKSEGFYHQGFEKAFADENIQKVKQIESLLREKGVMNPNASFFEASDFD